MLVLVLPLGIAREFVILSEVYFPTTHWSLLAQATLSGETAGKQALEDLFRRYWSPIQQFIRGRGYNETEAEDLTQDFVVHLLEHSTLKKADRLRGRFRSFLLGALSRFLADEYDRRHAAKRGSGVAPISLEEEPALPVASEPAEILFDREWALVILENSLRALRKEFESGDASRRFAVLGRFLPGSLDVPTYEEASAQLGLTLPALKSELHRLRLRFKTLVRQEIAATVSAPHEIDEEMNYLQQILIAKDNDLTVSQKPPPPVS
jgi:RNA polymerase sigma-70 factor (ECF subfamily)